MRFRSPSIAKSVGTVEFAYTKREECHVLGINQTIGHDVDRCGRYRADPVGGDPRGGGRRAQVDQDRLRDLADGSLRARRRRDHARQLPALGEGRERQGRHHAVQVRQARADRGQGLRQQELAGRGRPQHRAADALGQGRLRAGALGHRDPPGRRPALRAPRLPPARLHVGDGQGAGPAQPVHEHVLAARPADAPGRRPDQGAYQAEGRRQDQQQGRDRLRLRPARRRDGGASCCPRRASRSSTTRAIRSARRTCRPRSTR